MRKTGTDDLEMEEVLAPSSASIFRLPNYKAIPDPDLPLDEFGRKVYNDKCRELLEMGMLTSRSREVVEMMALAKQSIAKAMNEGKEVARYHTEALRSANLQFGKLDADKSLGEASGNGSEFAHFGFARRERKNRFGK